MQNCKLINFFTCISAQIIRLTSRRIVSFVETKSEDVVDIRHPERSRKVCKCTTADRGKTKDGIKIPTFKEIFLNVILFIIRLLKFT